MRVRYRATTTEVQLGAYASKLASSRPLLRIKMKLSQLLFERVVGPARDAFLALACPSA